MSKVARWIAEILDTFYDPYACGFCDLPGGVRRLRAERGDLSFCRWCRLLHRGEA